MKDSGDADVLLLGIMVKKPKTTNKTENTSLIEFFLEFRQAHHFSTAHGRSQR
jgi:hypothetical protein